MKYKIIGCAIEVYRNLAPGLPERVYQKCFTHGLVVKSLNFKSQLIIPVNYEGVIPEANLRVDVLVEDLIIAELKAMDGILPVHEEQLLACMKLLQKPKGVLINFNCTNIFKEGQKALVNKYYSALPA